MCVWECGVGVMFVFGSLFCVIVVVVVCCGLMGCQVQIEFDGGIIWIDWCEDGVWMIGLMMMVFQGVFMDDFFEVVK